MTTYQEEIERIRTAIEELTNDKNNVRYEYKVVTLEEETGSSLAEVLNYWSVTGNWYYAESLYLDEEWVAILERKVVDD